MCARVRAWERESGEKDVFVCQERSHRGVWESSMCYSLSWYVSFFDTLRSPFPISLFLLYLGYQFENELQLQILSVCLCFNWFCLQNEIKKKIENQSFKQRVKLKSQWTKLREILTALFFCELNKKPHCSIITLLLYVFWPLGPNQSFWLNSVWLVFCLLSNIFIWAPGELPESCVTHEKKLLGEIISRYGKVRAPSWGDSVSNWSHQ